MVVSKASKLGPRMAVCRQDRICYTSKPIPHLHMCCQAMACDYWKTAMCSRKKSTDGVTCVVFVCPVLLATHEGASTNNVAMRTLGIIYPNVFDVFHTPLTVSVAISSWISLSPTAQR